MKRSSTYLLLGSVALAGVAAFTLSASLTSCITEHARPVVEAGASAIDCDSGGPGGFPAANCDPSDNSCPSTGGTCPIDTAKCGDPNTCLPLADNSKKTTFDFRLRRLLITSPPSLVGTGGVGLGLVQTTVIDLGVDLHEIECGDKGTGAFNWILHVDPTASNITTGGAPPSSNPFTVGYCFYRHQLGQLDIEPAQTAITYDDAGAFTTSPIALLNVPVFLSPDAGAADPANVIILPLRQAVLKQALVTNNNNCIGSYNLKALGQSCTVADPSSCVKWHTAGSLGAIMTLEDADKVPLSILPETLCALLTQTSPDPTTHGCMRDGSNKIMAKGDYCSTSQKAGDCQDSFWLSAVFAASAVNINDGSSEPTCQGGGGDGGTDSGTDASTDGGTGDASGD